MKRRDFVKSIGTIGLGLAAGLTPMFTESSIVVVPAMANPLDVVGTIGWLPEFKCVALNPMKSIRVFIDE